MNNESTFRKKNASQLFSKKLICTSLEDPRVCVFVKKGDLTKEKEGEEVAEEVVWLLARASRG
jgi:hypothetical protein